MSHMVREGGARVWSGSRRDGALSVFPHRDDGPVVEWDDGSKYWIEDGLVAWDGGEGRGLPRWARVGRPRG